MGETSFWGHGEDTMRLIETVVCKDGACHTDILGTLQGSISPERDMHHQPVTRALCKEASRGLNGQAPFPLLEKIG